MKVLKRAISAKDGEGVVRLRCEDGEDLWHAYNLIEAGDRVRCTTLRKVTKSSSTGSVTSNKMRLTLTLAVTRTEFDAEGGVLRVTGRNAESNPHVQMGAHHTLDIEENRDFSIEKVRSLQEPETGSPRPRARLSDGLPPSAVGMQWPSIGSTWRATRTALPRSPSW
eukprot:scaffold4635_cov267-Pinguiococcus_pyrenoidosus.AAC.26